MGYLLVGTVFALGKEEEGSWVDRHGGARGKTVVRLTEAHLRLVARRTRLFISKTLTFLELTYFVLFMLGMTCWPLPGAPVDKLNKLCFYVFPILVQHYSLVYRTIL